jgi:hypothetical protein
MSLDKKILSEIERYRSINKYILEQAEAAPIEDLGALAPAPGEVGAGAPPPPAPAGATPPPAPGQTEPQIIDVENDPDVEKIDDNGKSEESESSSTEELDITDLVDSQKNIEQKQEEYFNNLFGQLNDLTSKLGEMDKIMDKLNTLENKIEKYREKTPQEKLELRTLDSYPFSQKLSQFFDDKKEDLEKTGKHEYVLTTDEIEDMNVNDVKSSFKPGFNDDTGFDNLK